MSKRRTAKELIDSINALAHDAGIKTIVDSISLLKKNAQNPIDLKTQIESFSQVSLFKGLSLALDYFINGEGKNMNPEQAEKAMKKIIEPLVLDWIKENMPKITQKVIHDVIEKNQLDKKIKAKIEK